MNHESLALQHIGRRGLLLGAAGLGLAACSSSSSGTSTTPSQTLSIAHRGGGGNWPEMTLYAYQQAVQYKGLSGMEVSVHLSKDGVLVCSHDPDTKRVGSKDLTIASTPWSELSQVMIQPKNTDDPSQPSRPITRLDELLEWWPASMPLWIEPKVHSAVAPLQKILATAKASTIVWKQPINMKNFVYAHHQGWRTWGYVLDGPRQQAYAQKLASSNDIDMLGAWSNCTDDEVRGVVRAAGDKPTFMWQINTAADRDRALRLGCRGLMVSNVKQLVRR